MKNINLLTKEYKNKIEYELVKKMSTAFMAVIFLFSILLVMFLNVTMSRIDSKIAFLEDKVNLKSYRVSDDLALNIQEAKYINEDLKVASKKIKFYDMDLSEIMKFISKSVDNDVAIGKIIYLKDEYKINVTCFTRQKQSVIDFMNFLNLNSNFKEVSIKNLKSSVHTSFEIDIFLE